MSRQERRQVRTMVNYVVGVHFLKSSEVGRELQPSRDPLLSLAHAS